MSDIIEDIVKDVEIKPDKSKIIIKWLLRVGYLLIGAAFIFGQSKMGHLAKLNYLEKSLESQSKMQIEMKQEMKDGFEKVNARIDKVYDDGYKAFDDFQQYNNKQLGLLIDYGKTDKDLLKRMLELNTFEKTKSVENNLQQAKKESPNYSIQVRPVSKIGYNNLPYQSLLTAINGNDHDTAFTVIGATIEYVNLIKGKNYYNIGDVKPSQKYSGLFDFTYKNKK